MAAQTIRLIIGLAISLGLGTLLTPIFLKAIRINVYKVHDKTYEKRAPSGTPPWFTGVLERFFFTLAVAFNVGGAAVAMTSWILVKMVTDWHRYIEDKGDLEGNLAFSALLGSMISLSFALVGGLVGKAC